jgi:hypothetical protein
LIDKSTGEQTMIDIEVEQVDKRSLWTRALYMLLMALILELCGTLLFALIVVQFLLVMFTDAPNVRLAMFSRSLGQYVKQIVWFLTFGSEDAPFPFMDWPSGD